MVDVAVAEIVRRNIVTATFSTKNHVWNPKETFSLVRWIMEAYHTGIVFPVAEYMLRVYYLHMKNNDNVNHLRVDGGQGKTYENIAELLYEDLAKITKCPPQQAYAVLQLLSWYAHGQVTKEMAAAFTRAHEELVQEGFTLAFPDELPILHQPLNASDDWTAQFNNLVEKYRQLTPGVTSRKICQLLRTTEANFYAYVAGRRRPRREADRIAVLAVMEELVEERQLAVQATGTMN